MAVSSVLVPIIVAVIGVVGAVVPAIYVNSLQTQPEPDLTISGFGYRHLDTNSAPGGNVTTFSIEVDNRLGNQPVTNLSLILECAGGPLFGIKYIESDFSTTDIVLPQYNNTVLESAPSPGYNRTVNQQNLVIYTPMLIHGIGSSIELLTETTCNFLEVHAIYDQGSDLLTIYQNSPVTTEESSLNIAEAGEEFTKGILNYILFALFTPVFQYYIVFFTILGIVTHLYLRRRKTMKRFLSKVVKNIVEIRGVLLDDLNNKDIFPEVWFEIPEKKRQDNHDIGDYLIIDDFYSKLKRRNLYLSRDIEKEDSDLSRANTLSKLNEAILSAAENVLIKVDWNKYR